MCRCRWKGSKGETNHGVREQGPDEAKTSFVTLAGASARLAVKLVLRA